MAYGQKNYLQVMGIGGKYRIDQIGCFLTTICNWLERKGRGKSPVDLNAQFVNNGTYCDIDDGIKDDLGPYAFHAADGLSNCSGWITGAPDTNDAIVEFQYNGKSGFTTHYCLVADHNAGTIVDSWDGVVKSWNVYGGPKRFARITSDEPVAVAPVSNPAPVASNGDQTGKVLVLPGTVNSWRVYRVGGPWTVGHEIAKLNPQQFGGLEYDILNTLAANVYVIQTQMFGQVAIYAGPDTPASFKAKEQPAPAPAPQPAPEQPAPAPVEQPAAAPAPAAPALPELNYEKYPDARVKRVKGGEAVDIWDFGKATDLAQIVATGKTLTAGGDFEAVGQVQTLGYTFLVNQEQFDAKDGTGVFDHDLEDRDNPELDPSSALLDDLYGPKNWQNSFDTDNKGDWDSEEDYIAHDLSDPTRPGIKVPKGQLIHIVGSFLGPDGNGYCKFVTKTYGTDHWYGIPPALIGADPIKREDDDASFLNIAARKPKNVRERVVAWIGLVWDTITLIGKNKKGTKK